MHCMENTESTGASWTSRHLVSALLSLAGLTALFFFPVVFQGKVIAPMDILDHLMRPWSDGSRGFGVHNAMVYDAISQYLPYDWTVFRSLNEDGFIGWNPYVYGGFSMAENTMQCPGDWHHQLYRFFDFWTAWNLGVVIQFALAGFGMLAMLRGEGLSASAALLGAVCFAFYSQHVTWIYHRWVLGASCWFPWMAWAIRRARRKKRLFDPASIVFVALALRGGSLQTCLYVALLCLALFAAEAWEKWMSEIHAIAGKSLETAKSREPGFEVNLFVFWSELVIGATILSLDVMRNTIPACLSGSRDLAAQTWIGCLKRVPHLGTLLLPSAFGSPQTMDFGKAFGSDIFETIFFGATAFVLVAAAFATKKSPSAPKICIGLVSLVTFTALVKWFYFRSTVVLAFGCAWLAAWALDHAREVFSDRSWRWIARGGTAIIAAWVVAGAAVVVLTPRILPVLHGHVESSLQAYKASRRDWIVARADSFIAEFPAWMLSHALPLVLAAAGLFATWRISNGKRTALGTLEIGKACRLHGWREKFSMWNPLRVVESGKSCAVAVVLCTFGELFVWSRTWITFGDRPDTVETGTLYPSRDWASELRNEMSDGGFLWIFDRVSDFDYLQINSQIGIGISCLQGYETIRPKTLSDPDSKTFDQTSFADRGVSHVLVRPGEKVPEGLLGWAEVINTDKLHLFRNPAFKSRFVAALANGDEVPVSPNEATPNMMRFKLPAGTKSLRMAMPFHPGWKARNANERGGLPVVRTGIGATAVEFPEPLDRESDVQHRFRRL